MQDDEKDTVFIDYRSERPASRPELDRLETLGKNSDLSDHELLMEFSEAVTKKLGIDVIDRINNIQRGVIEELAVKHGVEARDVVGFAKDLLSGRDTGPKMQ